MKFDKKFLLGSKYTPLFAGLVILFASCSAFFIMQKLRPEPKTIPEAENLRTVKVIKIHKKDLSPEIIAYGTVRPRRVVEIHAEVKGRVAKCISDFKPGRIVNGGEILLEIEKADYTIALSEADAKLDEIRASIAEMKQKQQDDTARLEVLEKDLGLSAKNFDRTKNLFEKSAISELELDKAEQAFINKKNELIQLRGLVAQYSSKLALLAAQEKSSEAKKSMAVLNLERCVIKSPFHGRIESGSIEVGQFISAGEKILSLADDRLMEISAPIESSEALMLGLARSQDGYSNWFGGLDKVHAIIEWVDNPRKYFWEGVATRIERYDAETRTVALIISPIEETPENESMVSKIFNIGNLLKKDKNGGRGAPLISGMFCKLRLKGPPIKDIFEIPRNAMQFKGKVAVVDEHGRVSGRDLSILYRGEDSIFVEKGLSEGELVVAQRLPFGMTSGMKVKIQQE